MIYRTYDRLNAEQRLLLIAIFLVPFSGVRLPIGLGLSELALIAAWLVRLFVPARRHLVDDDLSMNVRRGLRPETVVYVTGSVSILAGLSLASLLQRDSSFSALTIIGQYCFSLLFVPFLLGRVISMSKAIKFLVLGQSCGVVLALLLRMGSLSSLLDPVVSERMVSFSRFNAMYGNPNAMSKVLAITLPLLVFAYMGGVIGRAAFWIHCSLWAWAVLAAASFGGVIGFTLASVICVLACLRFSSKSLFIATLAVVIVAVLPLLPLGRVGDYLPQRFHERIIEPSQDEEALLDIGSGREKTELASQAWARIGSDPIIGTGAGGYASLDGVDGQVHNSYLLIWSEGGLLSLGGMALIAASLAVLGGRLLGAGSWLSRRAGILYLGSLLTLGVALLTSTHPYGRYYIVPIALFAHVVIRLWNPNRSDGLTVDPALGVKP